MTDEEKTVIRPDTSNYVSGRSASGSKTMNNGDPVALALDGLTLDEVKEVAESMGFEDVDKYDHLNIGQRRMNLGNRIRGAIAKADKAKALLEEKANEEGATKAVQAEAKRAKTGEELLEAACKGPHKERESRRKAQSEKAKGKQKAA